MVALRVVERDTTLPQNEARTACRLISQREAGRNGWAVRPDRTAGSIDAAAMRESGNAPDGYAIRPIPADDERQSGNGPLNAADTRRAAA